MSGNPTLNRLVATTGDLLVNPFLEHLDRITAYVSNVNLTEFFNTMQIVPGWYDFTPDDASASTDVTWPTVGDNENPWETGTRVGTPVSTSHPSNGARLKQPQNTLRGLCQPIYRASALRGKKVRISGVYSIKEDPDNLVGISLWLKSDKQSVAVNNTTDWIAGGRGYDSIDLPGTTGKVHHIIRMSGDADYGEGEELFNRAFDSWDPNGAGVDRIVLGGPAANQGIGANGRQAMTVWYLGENFSAGTGIAELYSEKNQVADDTLRYFEAVVEVPDEANLFEDDDCWFVLFPVAPADIGSMTGDAQIDLWAVSLEFIADDSAEDRLKSKLLSHAYTPNPIGYGLGGLPARWLLRYPIYQFSMYPLRLTTAQRSVGTGTLVFTDPEVEHNVEYTPISSSTGVVFAQDPLPPGSCVIGAEARYVTGVTTVSVYLMQHNNDILSASEPALKIIEDTMTSGSGVNTFDAFRNRIGLAWPDTVVGVIEGSAKLSAADVYLYLEGAGVSLVEYQGRYLAALVDPRWGYAEWGRP